MKPKHLLLFLLCAHASFGLAQEMPAYLNENRATEERVNDLLQRMTLKEKCSQLLDQSPAIPRLEVPAYNWWNESLHGVARAGYATVFPQSISIAASWNKTLIHQVATAISDEARAKYHEFQRRGQTDRYQGLTMWSPNINIFRDPRWGRGHETYGEDPYLTAMLGGEYVKGLQGDNSKYLKVIATAKHYAVHSGPEALRHQFDVSVSDRDLHETYLPAFKHLVENAKVHSVMTAYNSFRGKACSANNFLLQTLRNDWGFSGYVVSDCAALRDIWRDHKQAKDAAEAAAMALKAGTDLNCGSTYEAIQEAIERKLCTEDDVNACLRRLLTARFKLGMFDPTDAVPYANIPLAVNDNPAHTQLARKAAQESIVLLKNQNKILPLPKKAKKVAVIGPNAHNVQSLWGNYSGVPSQPITVFEGIKHKLGPDVEVQYEVGSDLAENMPLFEPISSCFLQTTDGKQGLTAQYFANHELKGEPLYTQVDDQVNFNWDNQTPDPRLKTGQFSVRWTGYLEVPQTGEYQITEWSKPFMTVKLQGKESGGKNGHHPRIRPKTYQLEAHKKYPITVEYQNTWGDATAQLLWARPNEKKLERAVNLAQKSDYVILALGLNERLEGEEMNVEIAGFSQGDRTSLHLPQEQEKLMKALVETGKPVVLVLINGSALAINWAAEHVPAILTAGYPGQQGGNAIADVLYGDYNPAGRLPITYYKSVDQLPDFQNYDMAGRTYRYFTQEPLYPFGFGLSYAQFNYKNLQITPNIKSKSVHLSVEVSNTGNVDGDEVVQAYLTDEKASTPRPLRSLVAFERVHIKKGESKTLHFTLSAEQFSLINKKGKRVVEPGTFRLTVGGEQAGFSGRCHAETTHTVEQKITLGKTWEQFAP